MNHRLFLSIVMCLAFVVTTGCEDDDYDHVPSQGMGSVIVDNFTSGDIELYVDGSYIGRIGDGHDRAFDYAPGVYRIVLDERKGDQNYRDDIDVLEGRLTIMKVRPGFEYADGYEYDVDIEFD